MICFKSVGLAAEPIGIYTNMHTIARVKNSHATSDMFDFNTQENWVKHIKIQRYHELVVSNFYTKSHTSIIGYATDDSG